ncbi:MAG TPA: hypothetical protein PK156_10775, partial [Polyangium sp.]|nr:hypothetical protein [Polyangium sp.]
YHLLDTEIRKWERTYRVSWDKLERLRANRGECCFRHDYLPKEVDIVKRYKDSMKKSKTGIVIQLLHSFIEIGGHFLHDVSMICANYAKGLKSIICHVLKCKREDARIILIKT